MKGNPLSRTMVQDHKFSKDEIDYFKQFDWGKKAIADNERLYPATPKHSANIDPDIYEHVSKMKADEVRKALADNNIEYSGKTLSGAKTKLGEFLTAQKVQQKDSNSERTD